MTERERGSTITEVLVVLAVSGIVSVALLLALSRGLRTGTSIEADLERDRREARIAQVLGDDLRQSELDASVVGTVDLSETVALTSTDETGFGQTLTWSIAGGELSRQTRNLETGRSSVILYGPAHGLTVTYSNADDRRITLSDSSDFACVRLVEVNLELADDEDPVSVTVAPRVGGWAESC